MTTTIRLQCSSLPEALRFVPVGSTFTIEFTGKITQKDESVGYAVVAFDDVQLHEFEREKDGTNQEMRDAFQYAKTQTSGTMS